MGEEDKKAEEEKKEEDKLKAEEAKKKAEKDKTPELDMVKDAKEAAAAIKGENDRRQKLIEEEEKLLDRKEALNALGGGSPAGDRPGNKEETPKEYKDRLMKGEEERKNEEVGSENRE